VIRSSCVGLMRKEKKRKQLFIRRPCKLKVIKGKLEAYLSATSLSLSFANPLCLIEDEYIPYMRTLLCAAANPPNYLQRRYSFAKLAASRASAARRYMRISPETRQKYNKYLGYKPLQHWLSFSIGKVLGKKTRHRTPYVTQITLTTFNCPLVRGIYTSSYHSLQRGPEVSGTPEVHVLFPGKANHTYIHLFGSN